MRILAMMSGGVDSSVTAHLLKESGHEVAGVTMKLYEGGDEGPGCCGGSRDAGTAKECARILGIPHRTLNEAQAFKDLVIEPFKNSYQAGETPNPCVECNRSMKFARILDLARSWGYEAVATGHYAKICQSPIANRQSLFKSRDSNKDQSYFLYMLQEEQLKRIHFPLGNLEKTEVRDIARKAGLPTADKEESQDICFVGAMGGDYRTLIEDTDRPGNIVYQKDGKVLGRHSGFARYTLGQREGLGVAVGHPLYVTMIEPKTNTVYVGENEHLDKTFVHVEDISWVNSDTSMRIPFNTTVKLRYRAPEVACHIENAANDTLKVSFESAQRAPTPGQFAVFYDGDEVLGGGKISRRGDRSKS